MRLPPGRLMEAVFRGGAPPAPPGTRERAGPGGGQSPRWQADQAEHHHEGPERERPEWGLIWQGTEGHELGARPGQANPALRQARGPPPLPPKITQLPRKSRVGRRLTAQVWPAASRTLLPGLADRDRAVRRGRAIRVRWLVLVVSRLVQDGAGHCLAGDRGAGERSQRPAGVEPGDAGRDGSALDPPGQRRTVLRAHVGADLCHPRVNMPGQDVGRPARRSPRRPPDVFFPAALSLPKTSSGLVTRRRGVDCGCGDGGGCAGRPHGMMSARAVATGLPGRLERVRGAAAAADG